MPSRAANDTLTIGWAPETATLDPPGNDNNQDIWVMVNIYDQLVRVAPDGKHNRAGPGYLLGPLEG